MPSNPDLSPAVVRDEEPWYTKPCTCGHSARDHIDMGAPQLGSCIDCDCRAFRDPASPVSVPEERQDDLAGALILATERAAEFATKYERLQSALDALAVAVKGCDAELLDGTLCGEYDATQIALCAGCRRRRDMAIRSLLDGRTTT